MTPEPLTADERPRVSDERLALLLHAMPFVDPKSAQDEFIAVIADLRDARARIAEVEAERDEARRDWAMNVGPESLLRDLSEEKRAREAAEVGERAYYARACSAESRADEYREQRDNEAGEVAFERARAEAAETALAEARAALEKAANDLDATAAFVEEQTRFKATARAIRADAASARAPRGGPANG